MSVINNNLLLGDEGYLLERSLRFRSSASAYLTRTPSVTGNRRTWTASLWFKRGTLGVAQILLGATGSSRATYINLNASNQLQIYSATSAGGGDGGEYITTQVFRDPSAWYHIVISYDSTQATSTNRIKLWVNGQQVTAWATSTAPTLNHDSQFNWTGAAMDICRYNASFYVDGYLAEVNFIDGQALTQSSFGETSATTGVWIPKKYTGTYGTNGFYLPFTDNSALTTSSNAGLGKDFSGNSNYWTTNNISITSGSTYDSMTDVPTLTSPTAANYCVLNPLIVGNVISPTNANLTSSLSAGGNAYFNSVATIPITSGKWYWEATITSREASAGQWVQLGIVSSTTTYTNNALGYSGNMSNGYAYYNDGTKAGNGTVTVGYGATFNTNDVIGIAFDDDAGTLTFYKNGVSQGQAFSGISTTTAWLPIFQSYRSNITTNAAALNFGQRPFAYTPPTGFVALNTFNLPTPTIGATASTQANKYFDIALYTGNSGSQSITSLGFQPDLVWLKSRSNSATNHLLEDVIRGTKNSLLSNDTSAELARGINAFLSNGFSFNDFAGGDGNSSGQTYVAWNWKANGSGSTNTSGTITSTVSANTSAGFSIVTWTGNNIDGSTIGHGLGVNPAMIIVKRRTNISQWVVMHKSLTANNNIFLSVTNAQDAITNVSGGGISTTTTSTTFTAKIGSSNIDNVCATSNTYVAYCFAEVAGYSAFGKYTGNGSTDGTFVYTGFRPRWILIKRTDTTASWYIYDTTRKTFNTINEWLSPNQAVAENSATTWEVDIVSNGFKIRNNGAFSNANGGTYIYACFAESPFKYSLAR
jgi:hypothetical protein